jgi:hypothetical protein
LASNDAAWGIRLNSLEQLKHEFSRISAPLIVVKPLVESQNIPQLLNYLENSKAVWMFRNYKDVALSNINHFGVRNGINDLRAIVDNEPNNWRSEKVSRHIRETISTYFSENMNPYDAAVLFWFVRNSFYFELRLQEDSRVMLCCYEDLVFAPEKYMRKIYQQIGQAYPGTNITSQVNSRSRQKGKHLELSPEVEQLAQGLQDKLDAVYHAKAILP